MEGGNTVTAATGSLGPVIAKLTHLLGKEYQLRRQTRRDIRRITSKLKSIHSLLSKTWDSSEPDVEDASDGFNIPIGSSPSPLVEPGRARTDLKMEALELADDMEDAVDDFLMNLRKNSTATEGEEHTRLGCTGGRELKKANTTVRRSFKQTHTQPLPFQDLMERLRHVSKRCRNKWKRRRNTLTICSSSSSNPLRIDPRAPFLAKDSSKLVCMDGRMDKPVKFLVEKEGSNPQPQLKMVSITGSAGVGKTALAHQLYGAIGDKFDSRAIVSVTPRPNMKEILTSILKQVTAHSTAPFSGTQGAANEKNLILKISNFLMDKRYLVIIDDIWQLEAWETIKKSLPENTIGSRIVMTTRNNDVAEKCSNGSDALVYKINFLGDTATTKMVRKADIVGEGFEHSHPVVRMCGGMPLALGCMMAAVAREEHQQGPGIEISHIQDKIVKEVLRHGIKNSLEFKPLEASFQVGYDDLPHHMLKSCLLYCSIYPENWRIARNHLVRKWMYEGFVDGEKEANNYFDDLVNRGWIQLRKEYEEEDGEEDEVEEEEEAFVDEEKAASDHFDELVHGGQIEQKEEEEEKIKQEEEGFVHEEKARNDHFDEPVNRGQIRRKEEEEEEEEQEKEKEEEEEEEDEEEAGEDYNDTEKWEWEEEEDNEYGDGVEHFFMGQNVYTIHPMMRNFLQWKSREENFITYISDNTASYASGISRLCLDHWANPGAQGKVDLSGMNLSRIRSLIVFGDAKIVPFKLFKGLRVLDVQYSSGVHNDHVKDICGLLFVRHLLGLHGKGITEIPAEIVTLEHLETLDMSRSRITKVRKEMREMHQLKTFDVSCTMVGELQGEIIKELLNLEALDLSNTCLTELPEELKELQHLKILDVSYTKITKLPREIIECLVNLESLCARGTRLTELPKEVRKLRRLKTLDVSCTAIRKLQGEMIKELVDLETLDVSNTELTELPKEIENLEDLMSLDVSYTGLAELPNEIGKLKRLKTLDASGTLLSVLPNEIGFLEELETLNLDGTSKLSRLPREIGNLKRLKTLCLHDGLRWVPWEVAQLSRSLRVHNSGQVLIVPDCMRQAWMSPTLPSKLEEEGVILNLDMIDQFGVVKEQVIEAALVVSSQNMHIPEWINAHFRDLTYLDMRVCVLDQEGLSILREMPYLHTLVIKVDVVPGKPISISREGFTKLQVLTVESRFPRVTFQEGAMPKLKHIMLYFRSYAGPTHEDSPIGLTHLQSLNTVVIWTNCYYEDYNPCIAGAIRVVRKEVAQHRNSIGIGGINTDAYT